MPIEHTALHPVSEPATSSASRANTSPRGDLTGTPVLTRTRPQHQLQLGQSHPRKRPPAQQLLRPLDRRIHAARSRRLLAWSSYQLLLRLRERRGLPPLPRRQTHRRQLCPNAGRARSRLRQICNLHRYKSSLHPPRIPARHRLRRHRPYLDSSRSGSSRRSGPGCEELRHRHRLRRPLAKSGRRRNARPPRWLQRWRPHLHQPSRRPGGFTQSRSGDWQAPHRRPAKRFGPRRRLGRGTCQRHPRGLVSRRRRWHRHRRAIDTAPLCCSSSATPARSTSTCTPPRPRCGFAIPRWCAA